MATNKQIKTTSLFSACGSGGAVCTTSSRPKLQVQGARSVSDACKEVPWACLGNSLSNPRALLGDPSLFLLLFAGEHHLQPREARRGKEALLPAAPVLQPAVVLSLLGAAQASPGGFPQGTQNSHLYLQSLPGNTEPQAEILPGKVTTEGKESSEQEQGVGRLTRTLGKPTLPGYRKHLWVVLG